MSDLTPELNLVLAEDEDDTADYLTLQLRSSLQALDGMFSAATGHTHSGAHQGGALQFQNVLVSGNLTVNGTSLLKGTTTVQGALNAQAGATVTGNLGTGTLGSTGLATLQSLDVLTTGRHRGAATFDLGITVVGNGSIGPNLTVTQDLTVNRDLIVNRNAVLFGTLIVSGSITSGGSPVWTAATLPVSVPAAANTLVMRNVNGHIQASYISMTADLAPGVPTQLAGQNGDGFLRWWSASSLFARKVQSGQTAVITTVAGGFVDTAVTFPQAFTSTPVVVGALGGGPTGPTPHLWFTVLNETTTGFTVRILSDVVQTPKFNWIAEGAA